MSAIDEHNCKLASILGSHADFLKNVIHRTQQNNIPIEKYQIDHICFRCSSKKQYLEVCDQIINFKLGVKLLQGMIGGRPISTIQLTYPIIFESWSIPCLELTCPKFGRSHKNGYEHIEFVIDFDNSHGFMNSKCYLETFADQYPSVEFDRKAINKEINADLSISFDDDSSVKFHARPLYEVCSYELEHSHFIPVPEDYFDDVN